MTKEQEAIEKLTNGEKIDFNTLVRKLKKEGIENFAITKKEYIETVSSMLKEKDELYNKALSDLVKAEHKNIKQDEIIDLMAEQLAGLTIWNNEKEEPLILPDIEDVKQYFERKVENEN